LGLHRFLGTRFIVSITCPQTARRYVWIPACAAALLFMAGNASAGDMAERSPDSAATCQLNLQGSPVDALTLVDDRGNLEQLQKPGSRVSLPAGRYRVQEVQLQNGYECYAYAANDDSWFTLAPDKPHDLQLGAPFKAQVTATRQGRIIVLSYELKGVDGNDYYPAKRDIKPRFTVYTDGRMLGSEDFQYG
jgi:hypothetical protein